MKIIELMKVSTKLKPPFSDEDYRNFLDGALNSSKISEVQNHVDIYGNACIKTWIDTENMTLKVALLNPGEIFNENNYRW